MFKSTKKGIDISNLTNLLQLTRNIRLKVIECCKPLHAQLKIHYAAAKNLIVASMAHID